MAISKSELIAKVAEATELPKTVATKAVNTTLDIIVETVAAGDKVQLIGFGTFEQRERAARTGRNPQTGEELHIPATKVPAFKAGTPFKEAVK